MKRDPVITSKIMSSIKRKNTKPEKLLASAMWKKGLRYRKQYNVFGKPDFVFVRAKVAIFCDGDFWHGNNWRVRGYGAHEEEFKNYSEYWKNKIQKNAERDAIVTARLISEGWTVLRFWESLIKRDINECVIKIEQALGK